MRSRLRCLGVLLALGTTVVVAGCAMTSPPTYTQSTTTASANTVTSGRLSKGAAVGAATKTYQRYISLDDQILREKGKGAMRLRPFLSKSEYNDELATLHEAAARGLHVKGASQLIKLAPQRVDLTAKVLTAYVCVDLAKLRVLNERNEDVTPKSRPDRQTTVASFEWRTGRMVLTEENSWSGDSIC